MEKDKIYDCGYIMQIKYGMFSETITQCHFFCTKFLKEIEFT